MASTLRRSDRWRTEVLPIQAKWSNRFRQPNRMQWLRELGGHVASVFQDHWLSWAAMGCVSAAFFQLSLFWGLLVTGVLLFLFELKIATPDEE